MVLKSKQLLEVNKDRGSRSTTGSPVRRESFWVYGRARRPCGRCGTPIAHDLQGNTDADQRDVYFCPHCQPLAS